MSTTTRTQLAEIIRLHNQGFITDAEAYHRVCNLIATLPAVA